MVEARDLTDLKINVGASGEAVAELGVLLDGPPLAGAVLVDAGPQSLLLFRRPLLLRSPHRLPFFLLFRSSDLFSPPPPVARHPLPFSPRKLGLGLGPTFLWPRRRERTRTGIATSSLTGIR